MVSGFRFSARALAAAALIACSCVGAQAATTATPVDFDSPDTAIDSDDAAVAIEQADTKAVAVVAATPELSARVNGARNDARFQSLFSAWKQMDRPEPVAAVSIPSRRPVDRMALTSTFGTRSDPFTGRRARHNGLDIPGPIGTPIHATADGVIGRAQWVNGYGNYVEVEHGNAIETRYGHMSSIAVRSGQRVKRGDIVGYMGSTGRSTGSHLHYEVRIGGVPVNPVPFVQDEGSLAAIPHSGAAALGGPRN